MIAQVRSFNRTVTQRAGALDDAFLARGRPLGQARLLWEIGPDGADVRELRARLDLDSGYLSRLLRGLEEDGLVVTERGSADGRTRTARLTTAGHAERAVLDELSDQAAAALLEPLTERQRGRLVAAMAEVEALLASSAIRISACDPAHPDASSCLRAYFAELAVRFEGGFDAERTKPVAEEDLTPPAGLFLMAALHGEPVGCAAVRFRDGREAEIKRMWVAPSARGLGLGRRLLREAERRAAAGGAIRVRLDTNRALVEAIALYRSSGYREIAAFNDEPYAHHWFEKVLDQAAADSD